MKLLHLSDLHLGKRVNAFSLAEDQRYILGQILEIADREKPQGILIAGDIYDKPVPPAEAVTIFDGFLSALADREIPVFIISGNHDSAERLCFGARLVSARGVYFSPVYDGTLTPITLSDEYGPVDIYLLPFVKPAQLRNLFPEEKIDTFTSAVGKALEGLPLDPDRRNVLVTHQFVTGAERCDSEEVSVGGSDNVDAGVFRAFDYVALGHLHGPQQVGIESVRYCGSPLKYSFSEAAQEKSVTVVELFQKGTVRVRPYPLRPLREMAEIKGTYMELTDKAFYDSQDRNAYLHITLTDEEDIPEAVGKLRVVYPYLMKLDYDNSRTRQDLEIMTAAPEEHRSPFQLFSEFYEKQNGSGLSREQEDFLLPLIRQVWEGEP